MLGVGDLLFASDDLLFGVGDLDVDILYMSSCLGLCGRSECLVGKFCSERFLFLGCLCVLVLLLAPVKDGLGCGGGGVTGGCNI